MTSALIQKLSECKELRRILETTVSELGQSFNSNCCQVLLANPFDSNNALICESYSAQSRGKAGMHNDAPRMILPLTLNGRSFGSILLTRNSPWQTDEIDSAHLLTIKISEFIRQAQINDVLQRETFRGNFLSEIDSLMSYSLGIGDALFMVVNILGKALRASRCLFVCTDDKTAGWKCYEFWQQDKVKSCQEYHWPTNDSSLIAQTLHSHYPLKFYEGQANSYLTPAQAELQFSGSRSLLALPLEHDASVYGCVIIQQCDYRRDWTRDEIDMVQKAADRVAQALASLPEEKRIHKPIMRLHQRVVSPASQGEAMPGSSTLAHSLKGAFGQNSIPSATETLTQLPAQDPAGALHISVKSAKDQPAQAQAASPKPTIREAKSSADKLDSIKKKPGKKEPPAETTETPAAAPNIVSVRSKAKSGDQTTDTNKSEWGNLDAIPTPAAGPAMSGLGASMLPKVKAQASTTGNFLKGAVESQLPTAEKETPQPDPDKAPEPAAVVETEEQAKEKIERALAANEQGKQASDYIFSIPNVDTRTLGRIAGWVEEIEKKDKYLTPHATTVAEYACAIAAGLNLPPRDVNDIKIAALLHDVGKLGTAGEVLQKRDEDLDDAELLTIMRHPMDGAELLQSIPDLAACAPIVLAHHEEFNGNGYPQGLKGEEIPLAARIIFLANSYHGMVSDMCYGKGMDPKDAQKELRQGTDSLYDPKLVEIFLEYLQQPR